MGWRRVEKIDDIVDGGSRLNMGGESAGRASFPVQIESSAP